MPVIPTFSSYAPPPNLSEAFLGREKLRQEAAADAARISLGYATLQQRAVESEMEAAATRQALAQQALRQDQQAEINKAYRDQQLGLAEQRLANEQKMTEMKVADAAREFETGQRFYRRRQELQAANPGMDAAEIDRRAMVDTGFGYPGWSQSVSGGQRRGPVETASDRRLMLEMLKDQKEEARIKYALKYGARTPEYEKAYNEAVEPIDREMKALMDRIKNQSTAIPRSSMLEPPVQLATTPDQMMRPLSKPMFPGSNAPGLPPGSSMFIGTPPPNQFDMSQISTNRPKLVGVR